VHVLRSLLAEADLIMAVDGYPNLASLTPEALRGWAEKEPERRPERSFADRRFSVRPVVRRLG
jgi:hypothetical protein